MFYKNLLNLRHFSCLRDVLGKGKSLLVMILLLAITFAVKANPVDVQLARTVGAKFMQVNTMMKTTTADDLQLVKTYRTAADDAAFYVFNTANGFIMVSADNHLTPVIGYSDEGQLDIDNIPVQMEDYLQSFVRQLNDAIEQNIPIKEEVLEQWNLLQTTGRINNNRVNEGMEPLLTETWDQGSLYNNMCPSDPNGPNGHVYAGCVATAMGQIMHYWKYPTTGTGSHSYTPTGYPQQSANYGATTYDWNNMPDALSVSSSTTQINAIAKLLWHCGISVDMGYGPDGSSSYSSDVPNALTTYFRYANDMTFLYRSDYNDRAWFALLKGCLDMDQPVFHAGSNSGGGHAYICDAYNSSNQLHFNWGWSGNGNGFYSMNDNSYTDYNRAIINIHPLVNSSVTYQVTATASPTTGGTVTGAGSYQAYSPCTLTVTPAEGFTFVGWQENGKIVSTLPTYTFKVRKNRNVVALLEKPTVCSVSAEHYPDPANPDAPYIEVSWQQSFSYTESFDEGLNGWTLIDNDGDGHNWYHSATDGHGVQTMLSHSGTGHIVGESYCNATNTALTPDDYLVSPQKFQIMNGTTVSLWAAAQDANYPSEHFGVAVSATNNTSASAFTTVQEWTLTAKGEVQTNGGSTRDGKGDRTNGVWHQYTCNLSSYAGQEVWIAIRHFNCSDQFIINLDDVVISSPSGPQPPIASFSEAFENGMPANWTLIDGDGDGYNWEIYPYQGHSGVCISSASYINNVGVLYPNNFLVSPRVTLGGTLTFWACAQDSGYPAEHFGVAVSTTNNTSASAFTTVQEWTMTAKSDGPANGPRGSRAQGTWHQYTVNLSSYNGQSGYIAIRHFNCHDQFYLNVDDVDYGFSKGTSQIVGYRVYRTNCSNNGPYNPNNTTMLADGVTTSSYIDQSWENVANGSYKFGVSSVSNVGGESEILWSDCITKGTEYTITASASPSNAGTVSGGGLYWGGSTCTLTATAHTGYTFVNWTQNGNVVSTSPTYSFAVSASGAYVANFTLNSYNITVAANPANGGSVTGAGTYNHGTSCTLTATPNANYNFVNWTKNGTIVSSNPTYTFSVTSNGNYTANFSEEVYYTIIVEADPEEGGTVTGSGTFLQGQSCTVVATANSDYAFTNWKENGTVVSTNANYTFTVNGNRTLVAYFTATPPQPQEYTVTISADPYYGGTVVFGSKGTTTYDFDDGTMMNWTSLDADGDGNGWVSSSNPGIYHYTTFNGSGTGHNGSEAYVISGSYANQTAQALTPDNFLISPTKAAYSQISFYACAQDANYAAEHFGIAVSTTGNTSASSFTTIQEWTLTAKNSKAQGTWYNYTVDLSAYAGQDIWVAIRHFNCTDQFIINIDDITLTTGGDPISATFMEGQTCTVVATANSGYTFVNWTKNGNVVSTNASYSFTVTEDVSYVAHFELLSGVDENTKNDFVIYPNPVKDKLMVVSKETVDRCCIYTVLGSLVFSQDVNSDTFVVEIGTLRSGTYIIRLTTSDKVQTMRFIKD